MKKLLTVLCVAACGIGAAAQAQVVQAGDAERIEIKGLTQKMPDNMSGVAAGDAQARLAQAKSAAPYDTLHWHDEYTTEDCDSYYSLLPFGIQTLFGEERTLSPFGASFSGTGEVGATYQTEGNLYSIYARLDVTNAWVVGAVGYAYRIGSTAGWEREGVADFDQNQLSEVNGVKVPNLPYKIKGYPRVQKQQAYASYYDLFFQQREQLIELELPLSQQDAVEST
ncbi:MAG: hypothetical protein K2O01_02975, partial [Bacteroidales bacterium]|nr:hypothetical protein [Bacteroidales bacterium]